MNSNNYGFVFNDINIVGNIFQKRSKNLWGDKKIKNEIDYYLYIQTNKIRFSMPKLIDYSNNLLSIEYISNAETLTKIINRENINYYINIIKQEIRNIHSIKITIPNLIIKTDLREEIQDKVINRYNEYDWETNEISKLIISVNNKKIKKIEYYCDFIYNRLIELIGNRDYYCLIHGDIHLGNILENNFGKLYFIDPRGYFGKTKLFGLEEYDYAKLLFGISGYSVFDNLMVNELSIKDGNLYIDFIEEFEYIYEMSIFTEIEMLLSLSIWLGNNSCFMNINKKIMSLMIAFYYCEKYLSMD